MRSLFSQGALEALGNDGMLERYTQAQKILSTSMDFSRKYIFQNKDLGSLDPEVDEVKKMLGELSPEKLRSQEDAY